MAAEIIVGGGIVGCFFIILAFTSDSGWIHHHITVRITKLLFHCGPSAQIWCFLVPHFALVVEDACAVQDVVGSSDDLTGRVRGPWGVANKDGFFNFLEKNERKISIVGCFHSLILCIKFGRGYLGI